MKWYREHVRVVIAGVILLLLLSLTVASYVSDGSNSWLGIQLGRANAFLQEPVADAERGIASTLKGIFQFKKVLADNKELSEENAELRSQINELALSNHDLAELRRLTNQ